MVVVFRNQLGSVVAAAIKRWNGSWNPLLAEAIALRFAVQLAIRLGLQFVVFEADNLILINHLRSQAVDFNYVFRVANDISFLVSSIPFVKWSFVKRSGNVVVHELARMNVLDREKVWWGFCPPDIAPYVLSDSLSI